LSRRWRLTGDDALVGADLPSETIETILNWVVTVLCVDPYAQGVTVPNQRHPLMRIAEVPGADVAIVFLIADAFTVIELKKVIPF
jgi:hypothetical protein